MIPHKKNNNIFIFDVETTGLIPYDTQIHVKNIEKLPHIIQLSYLIYDSKKKDIIKKYNSYVQIPTHVEIPKNVIELTKINKKKCKKYGKPILNVLKDFYDGYMMCDKIVAHNLKFDKNMILVELCRNGMLLSQSMPYIFTLFNEKYHSKYNIETYCTMQNSIELCSIMVQSKTPGKPPYKKWPKLSELYSYLFTDEELPEDLHNSYIDTLICLRCYLRIAYNIEVVDFKNLCNEI
jgi:DNA polymerase III epsilon subunit-like protein